MPLSSLTVPQEASVLSAAAQAILEQKEFHALRALLSYPSTSTSIKELLNADLLALLAVLARKEAALQSENVSMDPAPLPGTPRGGTMRHVDEWRVEQGGFLEIKNSIGALLINETQRRQTQLESVKTDTFNRTINVAVRTGDTAVLSVMCVHTPPDWREFMLSSDPDARDLAHDVWQFPTGNREMMDLFIHSVALERRRNGKGVQFLKAESQRLAGQPGSDPARSTLGALKTFAKSFTSSSFTLPAVLQAFFRRRDPTD